MKKVLSIAGSDCSGGAGIQADLKTFSAHGVFGMSVIVSVVAENTSRVIDIQDITPDMIEKQIDAVFEDIEVDAVKIGMLSTPECMKAVAKKLLQYKPQNVVIDPVMYMLLGVSASSIAEAIQAQQDGADYLGVGAMFPTGTKTDADSVSMEELQKIRTAVSLPIVVIGGINKGNTGRFKPMGIDGLAVVSAIIAQSDIKAAAAELKDLFCGKEKKHGF